MFTLRQKAGATFAPEGMGDHVVTLAVYNLQPKYSWYALLFFREAIVTQHSSQTHFRYRCPICGKVFYWQNLQRRVDLRSILLHSGARVM